MDKLRPITLAGLAIITGGFAAILILAVGLLAGWPWIYSLLGWAAIAAIAWLLLMRRYLAIIGGEKFDPRVKPSKVYPAETTQTRIQITALDPAGAFSAGKFAELPINLDQLIAISKRLNSGVSFSYAGLAGPGRPLSRAEFESLRDKMIIDGLAYWINPVAHAQGVRLSRGGEAMIRHFAKKGLPGTLIPQRRSFPRRRGNSSKGAHARGRTRGNGKQRNLITGR